MAIYNKTELPKELPIILDELKVLSDNVQTVRTLAETDVQEGREQMDICDRQMKILKAKVEDIMGIKSIPSRPPKDLKPPTPTPSA